MLMMMGIKVEVSTIYFQCTFRNIEPHRHNIFLLSKSSFRKWEASHQTANQDQSLIFKLKTKEITKVNFRIPTWHTLALKVILLTLDWRHNDKHLLRLSPAFEDEDVSVDVLHTDPAGQRQWSISPNPVHHSSQLRQERHQAEPTNDRQVLAILAKYDTEIKSGTISLSRKSPSRIG